MNFVVENNLPYAILERLLVPFVAATWYQISRSGPRNWVCVNMRRKLAWHYRPIWFDEDFFESCIFEGFKSELFSWNKNQVLKLVHFLFYFVSICTKFSNIKLITKYYLTKKNFGIFFLKLSFRGSEAVSCVHDRGSSMLGAKILHCRRL